MAAKFANNKILHFLKTNRTFRAVCLELGNAFLCHGMKQESGKKRATKIHVGCQNN